MTRHRKKRLRGLIDAAPYNGSQSEFARAAGLSEGRISQLLDPDESFGERSAKKIEQELRLGDRYFEAGFTEVSETPFVEIRRVAVTFSNGNGQVVDSEDDKPPLSFRADYLRKMSIPTGKAVVVEAEGTSNYPKIVPGSVVLLNSADRERLNGDFFAFRAEGNLLIKRLTRMPDGKILATAENSEFKPKLTIYDEKTDDFEVIGRAVWTGVEL